MANQEEHEHPVKQENPAKTVWDRPAAVDSAPSWSRPASEHASITPSVPSWGAKAPLPPPPSPQQLMDILLQQFASDVRRAMTKVAALRQQRNMLLEERFVAFAKERLAVQQILQTETQQMDAAEREDFDLADRLQVVLDGHNREKAECSAILDNIGKALAQLDEQTPGVVNGVTNCFENVEKELKEFQAKQKEIDDPTDEMARFFATAKQLSSEGERLKGESKHLTRDESLVNMERKELDDAIAEQTADIEKVREEAKEQLDAVGREMDELRQKLRMKEAEAHQLTMKIESQDSGISMILVKFTRQITRVQKKETSDKENRREWENEKTAYEKLKEAHEAEVKAHSESLLQRDTILNALKSNISMAHTFQDIISHEVTFEHIREEDEEVDGNLAQIQADVVKCEAAVSEAAHLVKAAEANLVGLDGESKRILEKLPKLEEEKTKAAAKRDFKTAGKASKEIKEASIRLKELEDTLINEAKEKHTKAKAELEKFQKELEQEQATANEKEKESGRVSMEKIAQRIKALLDTKRRVCGKVSPDSVKAVGALVLKGQIDALKHEGESLGHKFGGWEEIIANIDEVKEPDDEADEEKPADADETAGGEEETADKAEEEERQESSRPSDEVIPENVEKAKELTKKLAKAEQDLNDAVEQEDFEKASTLDDIFQDIKNDLEKLDLTDAEADLVISDETLTDGDQPSADEGVEPSTPTDGDQPAADKGAEPSTPTDGEQPAADEGAKPSTPTDGEQSTVDEGAEPSTPTDGEQPAAADSAEPSAESTDEKQNDAVEEPSAESTEEKREDKKEDAVEDDEEAKEDQEETAQNGVSADETETDKEKDELYDTVQDQEPGENGEETQVAL